LNSDNFERPRFEDILERVDPQELRFTDNADGGYLTCCCPLHDDKHPSFFMAIKTQKFICYSCSPEWGDVISFWMKLNNATFPQALRQICTPLTETQMVENVLKKTEKSYYDEKLIMMRVNSLFSKHPYEKAYGLVVEAWQFFMEKRYAKLDSFLRRNFV
jgi:DNA primase